MRGGYGREPQKYRGSSVGPYGDVYRQQQNMNMGPSLFDMLPREQNYSNDGRDHRAQGRFPYPTNPMGHFAQAMSRITCNPTTAEQGTGQEQDLRKRELFEQLQMALSVQLGLSGRIMGVECHS